MKFMYKGKLEIKNFNYDNFNLTINEKDIIKHLFYEIRDIYCLPNTKEKGIQLEDVTLKIKIKDHK